MKKLLFLILFVIPAFVFSQTKPYNIPSDTLYLGANSTGTKLKLYVDKTTGRCYLDNNKNKRIVISDSLYWGAYRILSVADTTDILATQYWADLYFLRTNDSALFVTPYDSTKMHDYFDELKADKATTIGITGILPILSSAGAQDLSTNRTWTISLDTSNNRALTGTNTATISNKTIDGTCDIKTWTLIPGATFASATVSGNSITGKFYFPGANWQHLFKWSRSVFKSLSKGRTAAINPSSDFITIRAHGQDTGLIVKFVSATTLPTVASGKAIELMRPYFLVASKTDSFKIARTPSGTAINFTNSGDNIKIAVQKFGYVINISPSDDETVDTVQLVTNRVLDPNDSLFYLIHPRKTFDMQEYSLTGVKEVVADATSGNWQGRSVLDIKEPCIIFSANSALRKAGTTCTWNMFRNNLAMFTSAPAMGSGTTLNAQVPDINRQYIPQGSNINFMITAVGGNPEFYQSQCFIFRLALFSED